MSGNKDYLSQEEIDALLRQTTEDEPYSMALEPDINEYLTPMEQDALGEIGNITFGSAATALSTLLVQKVDITTPKVSIISRLSLETEFPRPHVAISVNYVDGFQGLNLLVIRTTDAQIIADLMLGGDGKNPEGEMNEIHLSAVQEAMNQMMGSSATSMSTIFNRFVNISPPGIDVFDMTTGEGASSIPMEDVFIKVSFRLLVGDLIDSSIMQLLPVQFAREMVSSLMGESGMSEQPAAAVAPPMRTPQPQYQQAPPMAPEAPAAVAQAPYQQPPMEYQQQAYIQQPAAYQQQPNPYQQPMMPPMQDFGHSMPNRNINVQNVQFSGFPAQSNMNVDHTNLNLLLDIPLRVTVELGRTQKVIKDILELSQGSIVELDKLAGEPVDILVNNKLIAKGEVVVIDENFGVRVTDIVSQWDRMQKIQ
ncbi:MAG: flagellar motor switch phosphatase FliY [Paenibacillaceae bacterium]